MRTSTYNIEGYKVFVPVAQLDRALASGARGCAFESHRGYSNAIREFSGLIAPVMT